MPSRPPSNAGRARARRTIPARGSSQRAGSRRSTFCAGAPASTGRSTPSRTSCTAPANQPADAEDDGIEDNRLRLIFTCCHPALPPDAQIAMTLREVCGLTTEEIAHAFLTTPSTVAQRIVRAKAKIRDARIPYQVPARDELPDRLDAVLHVIYLVFNEGYSASSGGTLVRHDLSSEAIRLVRLVIDLLSARRPADPRAARGAGTAGVAAAPRIAAAVAEHVGRRAGVAR